MRKVVQWTGIQSGLGGVFFERELSALKACYLNFHSGTSFQK